MLEAEGGQIRLQVIYLLVRKIHLPGVRNGLQTYTVNNSQPTPGSSSVCMIQVQIRAKILSGDNRIGFGEMILPFAPYRSSSTKRLWEPPFPADVAPEFPNKVQSGIPIMLATSAKAQKHSNSHPTS